MNIEDALLLMYFFVEEPRDVEQEEELFREVQEKHNTYRKGFNSARQYYREYRDTINSRKEEKNERTWFRSI
ncbi:hypothetical protein COF09_23015 [Bacillus toyonensis]|uniref:hypothetical protein n=1 Tax=Bacillus toyonensis TaxID=155322 RepID=UPI000BFD361A|nr:hypothetical protein [Bacillus toyonensis]PHC38955.1 hypothetical protein COF09_23015 [Bacillus toyonensis]